MKLGDVEDLDLTSQAVGGRLARPTELAPWPLLVADRYSMYSVAGISPGLWSLPTPRAIRWSGAGRAGHLCQNPGATDQVGHVGVPDPAISRARGAELLVIEDDEGVSER